MFMNERKSNNAHVTAARAALANLAKIGSGSFVFNQGGKFALTITPGTGDISVSSGVMSWNGRIAGVENPENVRYTPPESETLYKKIVVCAKYHKDTSDGTETVELVAFSSDAVASESVAASLSIDTGSSAITSATETANLPLWSFVATSNSATVPTCLFEEVPSLDELKNIISQEKKALQSLVGQNLSSTNSWIRTVENMVNGHTTSIQGLNADVNNLKNKKGIIELELKANYGEIFAVSGTVSSLGYTGFLIVADSEPIFVPAVVGDYVKKFYKIESVSMSTATKTTEIIATIRVLEAYGKAKVFFDCTNSTIKVNKIYAII